MSSLREDWCLLDATQESLREHMAEIHRLRAECDALRADAERYRLLRRGQKWSVIDGNGETLRAETLDAAIDAAREEMK